MKRNTVPEPESATIIINAQSFWRRIARQNLETFQINLVYFRHPWGNLVSLSLLLSFFLFSPKLVREGLNYGSMNAQAFVFSIASFLNDYTKILVVNSLENKLTQFPQRCKVAFDSQ